MATESPLDGLPAELLEMVAGDESAHRALLVYPRYARGVDAARTQRRLGYTVAVTANGVTEHRRRGRLHRVDGPARHLSRRAAARPDATLDFDECEYWYRDGVRHREDGPASVDAFGEAWYRRGVLHRDDGWAVRHCGGKYWYRNGVRHREDGPAAEYVTGVVEWWVDGKLQREYDPRPPTSLTAAVLAWSQQ